MDALDLRSDGVYVDGTYGRGGHSRAILSRLGETGRLISFDKDPAACADGWRLAATDARFRIERGSFSRLAEVLESEGLTGRVDGLLLDLGVSSPQLDEAERGFSFTRSGPLDMRMDPQSGESAAQWLATASHGEIARVLKTYGEEPYAGRIAAAIVDNRAQRPVETTAELARIVVEALPRKIQATARNHPATRSFQAIRIFINDELGDLQACLKQLPAVLAPGGRVAIIAFHSLEDRIVKRFLRSLAQPSQPELPMAPRVEPLLNIIGKPVRGGDREIAENPRARSAIMRVAERTRVEWSS